MHPAISAACLMLMMVGGAAHASSEQKLPGPRQDWVMHCRGCHLNDARGASGRVPALAGSVSRFLGSREGRAYLVRVPGVAFAPLPDDRLARLLNWVVQTFDPGHVPAGFKPYTGGEVKLLRTMPLVGKAGAVRQSLLAGFDIER